MENSLHKSLQNLESLIHLYNAEKKIVTEAFLNACRETAKRYGFDLKKDYMIINKAILPLQVDFDEKTEHIMIFESDKIPLENITFIRNAALSFIPLENISFV